MSISLVRKKCGIGPRDWASRFAIVLRIWVRGMSVKPEGSAGTAAAAARVGSARVRPCAGAAVPACSTSRLTTRPAGPEPGISLRSRPFSAASLRASGEERTRPAPARAPPTATAAGATAASVRPSVRPTSDEISSSAAPTIATVAPTGTVAPSASMTFRSTPSPRATSSITALSVSTSASVSPALTASPSCFFQATRRPSSMVGDSASITTLVAIGQER